MLPTINTYSVDENKICLNWEAIDKSNIWSWNLYGAPKLTILFSTPNNGVMLPGLFTKIMSINNMENVVATPGSVYVEVPRSLISIDQTSPYYFLITSVDKNGVESALDVENLHGVPAADDYFVDEAGWPVNQVYSTFEFGICGSRPFAPNMYLNIVNILGRPARQVRVVVTESNLSVKFNSIGNDTITVTPTDSFKLRRGELQVYSIYLANLTTTPAMVQIYVAG